MVDEALVEDGVVTVDVGGRLFRTRRSTLCACGYLRLCGESQSPSDTIFVDRDSEHFPTILNFLRSGCLVALPDNLLSLRVLRVEADFYSLSALVTLVDEAIEMEVARICADAGIRVKIAAALESMVENSIPRVVNALMQLRR